MPMTAKKTDDHCDGLEPDSTRVDWRAVVILIQASHNKLEVAQARSNPATLRYLRVGQVKT